MWEQLNSFDMQSLSGSDVLNVGKLRRSLHSTGQTLIQPSAACSRHQLQPRANHMTHNWEKYK